jgi:hypothetical protein
MTIIPNDYFNGQRYWSDSPNFMAIFDAVDASMDREDSLSERYAFLLGVELGTLRLDPVKRADGFSHWSCPAMEQGFGHGLTQPPKRSDVYLRKLLNLKVNAYARGIPVSSGITVDYLQSIAVTTCPVSGARLTQGTLTETDWSLDRLNNNLGYVPGNVCILSARVNTLKGELGFMALADEAQAKLQIYGPEGFAHEMSCGLLVMEGLRLASLMAAPAGFGEGRLASYAPFAMAPHAWSTLDAVVAGIHIACARTRLEGKAYAQRKAHFKRLGLLAWRDSNRLVEKIRSALIRGSHPADIWFEVESIELLGSLMKALLGNAPGLENVDPDTAVAAIKSGLKPIDQYARRRQDLG